MSLYLPAGSEAAYEAMHEGRGAYKCGPHFWSPVVGWVTIGVDPKTNRYIRELMVFEQCKCGAVKCLTPDCNATVDDTENYCEECKGE